MSAQNDIETFIFINIGFSGTYDIKNDLLDVVLIIIPKTKSELFSRCNSEDDYEYESFDFLPIKDYEIGSCLSLYDLKFSISEFEKLNSYIESCKKPVALISYSGFTFHYPILKRAIEGFSGLPSGLLCADLMQGIYELDAYAPTYTKESGEPPWKTTRMDFVRQKQFNLIFERTFGRKSKVLEEDYDEDYPFSKLEPIVEWAIFHAPIHKWLLLRSSYELFESQPLDINYTSLYDVDHDLSQVKLVVIPKSRQELFDGFEDEMDYDYHTFDFSPVKNYEARRSLSEYDLKFPIEEYERLTAFIQSWKKPVALISYAGFTFHYKILKEALKGYCGLPPGLLCVDLLQGVYELDNNFGPQAPRDSGILPWYFRNSEIMRVYQFSLMFYRTLGRECSVDEAIKDRSKADCDEGLPLPKLEAIMEWVSCFQPVQAWLRLRSSYALFDAEAAE